MKNLILICALLLLFQHTAQGQAKQRKELLLQITALQVYLDNARKGYSAVSKGLNFIGNAKKVELSLHNDYFISLLKINPKISNYYKTAEILSVQLKIMKICKGTCSDLKANDLFHGSELEHIERAFEALLENCSETLDQLLAVTTDARLELRDDQRISRIDALYKNMLEDYDFCLSFSRQARLLSLSRSREKTDMEHTTAIYGL